MMACVYFTLPLGGTCGIIAVSSLAHTEAMRDYFLKGPGYFPSFLGATVCLKGNQSCVYSRRVVKMFAVALGGFIPLFFNVLAFHICQCN